MALAIVVLASVPILSLLAPQVPVTDIEGAIGSMSFLAVGTALILVIARHRQLLEGERMAALAESEARYRAMVETQAEAVCRWLPDTTLTFVNEEYCRFFGRSRLDLLGEKWLSLIPKGTRQEVIRTYETLAANPRVWTYSHQVISADGDVRWQEWVDCPVLNADGRLVEFQSVGRDITARKRAEEEREKLIAELREALDKVKTLSGLLPICANCKKIRDDQGYWHQVEIFIREHSAAQFTHGICPDCAKELYPGFSAEDQ